MSRIFDRIFFLEEMLFLRADRQRCGQNRHEQIERRKVGWSLVLNVCMLSFCYPCACTCFLSAYQITWQALCEQKLRVLCMLSNCLRQDACAMTERKIFWLLEKESILIEKRFDLKPSGNIYFFKLVIVELWKLSLGDHGQVSQELSSPAILQI